METIKVKEVKLYYKENRYQGLYFEGGEFKVDFFNFDCIFEKTGNIPWEKVEGNKWERTVWRNPINGTKSVLQVLSWEMPSYDFSECKIFSPPSYEDWVKEMYLFHYEREETLFKRFHTNEPLLKREPLEAFIEKQERGDGLYGLHRYESEFSIWKNGAKRLSELKNE